jgi:class 3 adenylate cyclase
MSRLLLGLAATMQWDNGDAVNTVFRLEGLMKELDKPVLLSADFRQLLSTDEDLVELGERRLKGKLQAVRVYGLA